jgi:hypothetical protein
MYTGVYIAADYLKAALLLLLLQPANEQKDKRK